MKNIKNIFTALILTITLTACSSSDDTPEEIIDPVANLNLVDVIEDDLYQIELYSATDQLYVGYNELITRIKNKNSEDYVENASMNWTPVMHMTEMQHSCPKSQITETEISSVYKGFIVFQMSGNIEENWSLKVDFEINGEAYSITQNINVVNNEDEYRVVNVFKGNDESKYVLAMVPSELNVSINDFGAVLYKMENMMTFSIVENYTIAIDPRMPGMDNHSSPNNENLTFNAKSELYNGKLSLTMTGYWKVNLKVLNPNDEIIKGEEITDENKASSIYFDLSI
ncbi:hypothetical protein [Zhouia amylolytica]|uniref:YtkA-like domain-containing protein n=1 Tax=Zhouia amylolytica AD3 TaxID=1286632 RepID=W2UQK6_9FLAO|nr:hypothetical protein [Zhouia amylolytica]ETN95607.1 hypothetical protein P278_13290 [Zhouia amylolytica AD3]